jgi:hypothetical protein
MNETEVVGLIKQTGYWRVLCYPLRYKRELISELPNVKKLLVSNAVRWRGWDYPHVDEKNISFGQSHVGSFTLWNAFRELVKLYQSGQYIHLFSMHEDFRREPGAIPSGDVLPPGTAHVMDFIGLLYTVTEISEFVGRLARSEAGSSKYGTGGIHLSIELHGTAGRTLTSVYSPAMYIRGYTATQPVIKFERDFSEEDSLLIGPETGAEASQCLFHRFGWLDVPTTLIHEHQRNLVERRYQ